MNAPFSYHTTDPNNVFMQDLDEDKRRVDWNKALQQFLEIYHFLASESMVYLLPSDPDRNLQDLPFVSNLAVALEHKPGTIILSNFTSPPRMDEPLVGKPFFELMGYEVVQCPFKFEGEAELKHLYDNVYVGGYGIRSEPEAFDWMEENFDMKIIQVLSDDEWTYHLDCLVFPLTREKTIVCVEAFDETELTELKEHTEVIPVSYDLCVQATTNCVRVGNTIINGSNILELDKDSEEYKNELAKNRFLEDVAAENGFEVAYFNISEYYKGGAAISCMVMHLNRASYAVTLL